MKLLASISGLRLFSTSAKALTDGDLGSSNTLESIKAGAEESGVGPEGCQWGPWDAEFEVRDAEGESARALNDILNAARAKGPKGSGKQSLRGTVPPEVLKRFGCCRECGGRHAVSKCPNHIAGRDSGYRREVLYVQ